MEEKPPQIGKDVPPEEGLYHILMRGCYAGLGIAVLAVWLGVPRLEVSRDGAFFIVIGSLLAGVLLSVGLAHLQQSQPTSPTGRAIRAATTFWVASLITVGIVCFAIYQISKPWDHPPAPKYQGPPKLGKFGRSDEK
jgi:hypothetical protein